MHAVEERIQAIQNKRTKLNQILQPDDFRGTVGPYKWQASYFERGIRELDDFSMPERYRRQETRYINDIQAIANNKIGSLHAKGNLPPSKDRIETLADEVAAESQTETVNNILEGIAQKSEENLCFQNTLASKLTRVLNLKLTTSAISGMGKHKENDFYNFIRNIDPNPAHEKALAAKILSLSGELLQNPSASVDDIHRQVEAEIERFVEERSAPVIREFHEIIQAGKDSPADTFGNIFQWVVNQKTEQENVSVAGIGSACVSLMEGIKRHSSVEGGSAMINGLAEQQFNQSQWPPIRKSAFMRSLASAVSFVLEKEGMGEFIERLDKEEPPEQAAEMSSDPNLIPDGNEEEPSLFDQLPNNTQFLPSRQKSFTMELLEAWNSNTAS